MKLDQDLEYLKRENLLSPQEKESIFFASSEVPKDIKKFAFELKAELERREVIKTPIK